MKKTLFLCALCVAFCGQAFGTVVSGTGVTLGADTAFTPASSTDYVYTDLTIGTAGVSKVIGNGEMFHLYADGLSGSGNVTISRNHSGYNPAVIWLDGDCSGYTGTINLAANVDRGDNVRLGLGGTNGDLDLSKATLSMTRGVLYMNQNATVKALTLNNTVVSSTSYTDSLPVITDPASTAAFANLQYAITTGTDARTLSVGSLTLSNTTIGKGITINLTNGGSIGTGNTINGNLKVTKGTLTLNNNTTTYGSDSIITAARGTKIDISSASTQTISAVELQENSELHVRLNCTVGSAASRTAISMANGSVITLWSGKVYGDITIDQSTTIRGSQKGDGGWVGGTISGNGTLTLGTDSNGNSNVWEVASSVSDKAEGMLALVMDSKSVVTLSGANTYSGGTTIKQSKLKLASETALGAGDVTVMAGDGLCFADTLSHATIGGALTLNSGVTITLNEAHNGTLTTNGLTLDGDATFNGNLVVKGGELDFTSGGTLTMGCDVTIGNDEDSIVTVVLTQDMVESIKQGDYVAIIRNVNIATLGSHIEFRGADFELERPNVYELKQSGDKIYITPEPATATLSLLALAGLAARRRRH